MNGHPPLFYHGACGRAKGGRDAISGGCGHRSIYRVGVVFGVENVGRINKGEAMQMTRVAAVAMFLVGQLMCGLGESATRYSVATVDVPFPGGRSTVVTGVNAVGTWSGTWVSHENLIHSFTKLKNKSFSPLIPLVSLQGLNRAGSTVGSYGEHVLQGFLLTKSEFISINCPGAWSVRESCPRI